MKIVSSICTENPCYIKAKNELKPSGIMLHSSGTAQPKANNYIKQWNKSTWTTSLPHGIIGGDDGIFYQTLPFDMPAWHCGSGAKGSANNTHIGIEMAEPSGIKYTQASNFTIKDGKRDECREVAKRTYLTAVELFAQLCFDYAIDPTKDGAIISHAEGNERGIASNHVDPVHLWKGLGLNFTMNTFRRDVFDSYMEIKESMANQPVVPLVYRVRRRWVDTSSQVGAFTDLANAMACADRYGYRVYAPDGMIVYPKVQFVVRVKSSQLAIRSGPGNSFTNAGATGAGYFTIVDVCKGTEPSAMWGLLKAYEKKRNGWININAASVEFDRDLLE